MSMCVFVMLSGLGYLSLYTKESTLHDLLFTSSIDRTAQFVAHTHRQYLSELNYSAHKFKPEDNLEEKITDCQPSTYINFIC